MQDLASVFSKISGSDTSVPSQREGVTPSRPNTQAQAPGVVTLVPSTFQPWLRTWIVQLNY